MPQHGKKQVHRENMGQHPHHNRHEGEQEPGYTDLALEEGHDLIYLAEEQAHMHDDEKMNMPQSSSSKKSSQPQSSSQSQSAQQQKMSQMGKQGGMTQGKTAKMMPESSSSSSGNMPQGSSSGDMGKQQHMESGNKQSGGMGHKMGEGMKNMKEGMGKKWAI
ncbi:unnamed protein product [Sordaria macrospora k-hell]|uniref:WGS project CABT00000000 data, contig 2.50 n=1 Tax=Sordaria macrospora (strain ATCC MYA-333 / DSM 997 / K(L3346) / K-hell) TaxID=771870 RepID=F7W986_SORMK|nr:uncharacterized protein SMAC_08033 [Sordaria macrospora k-hell]CCC05166.1 unnamed protein product [Sordaria macrospora k-hell]